MVYVLLAIFSIYFVATFLRCFWKLSKASDEQTLNAYLTQTIINGSIIFLFVWLIKLLAN